MQQLSLYSDEYYAGEYVGDVHAMCVRVCAVCTVSKPRVRVIYTVRQRVLF